MDNRNLIQQSLDYIEDNLQAEITAAELAEQAGFSLYHYYRIFQQATGLPVMQYILRRRLPRPLNFCSPAGPSGPTGSTSPRRNT